MKFIKSLAAIGKHVIFTWILCSMGIHGNTVVDQEANDALDDINVYIKLILHSKWLSIVPSPWMVNFLCINLKSVCSSSLSVKSGPSVFGEKIKLSKS